MVVKDHATVSKKQKRCSTANFHMVVKEAMGKPELSESCSTANFHMVVKDRQCMLKHTLSCSTARFRMVVKASGTGVYMQMNEYGTDLDGYEVQNIKFTLNFAQKSSIFLPLKW